MKTILIILALSGALLAQTTDVDLGTLTIDDTSYASLMTLRKATYTASLATTLNGAINNSTTTVIVTDASGISASNGQITIDSEVMTVTSKSTNTLTVTRGASGSSAASHSDAAVVNVLTHKSDVVMIQAAISAWIGATIRQLAYDAVTISFGGDAMGGATVSYGP